MGVDLRRGDVHVAQQVLHRSNIGAGVQQMCGKGVSQRVRGDAFVESGRPGSFTNGVLKTGVQHMMPPLDAGEGFRRLTAREGQVDPG